MRDVLWLMKKILSVTFRKKRNIILYFGLPLIGIFIAFLAYGNPAQQDLQIGIVNQDQQPLANDTVQFLKGLNNVQIVEVNESQINDKIATGALDCAITFERGFSQSLLKGNPGHIQIASIKGAQVTSYVKAYLYNYLDNISSISRAANGAPNTFDKMYSAYQHEGFKVTVNSLKDTSKYKDMTYQTIGFLLMIMLISSGNFAEVIIKEKENRTYFRLLSTPINARKYVLSNVVVNLLVMAVQIMVTLFFMKVIFHIQMNASIWQTALVLLMFALVSAGLSLMIVSFAGSSASASALQTLISTPTCLLAGCFWPVDIMPKGVQKIADFLPQRWTLDTITKLQEGSHLSGLYVNFLILLAFALAFFLIAVYKFGRNDSVKNFV